MSYKSKYTGPQIDDILNSVAGKQNEIEDLASIRSGAAKGATALQSETYKGTITGVSANGTSVATSGVANIPAASTSAYGVTKLSSATNSTSTTLAATASAVKAAYDLANGKQEKLVSSTNIKTINGESILGNGDITISGGSDSIIFDVNKAGIEMGDGSEDNPGTFTTEQFQLATGMTYEEFREMVINEKSVILKLEDMYSISETVIVDEEFVGFYFPQEHTYLLLMLLCSHDEMSLTYRDLNDWAVELYYNKDEIDEINANKQEKLVSGTNIKTINGTSILGSGDITISGGSADDILIRTIYASDESAGEAPITEEQKAYNAETYRMIYDGLTPIIVLTGIVGVASLVVGGDDNTVYYADIFFKADMGEYIAGASFLLKSDGSVELGEQRFACKIAVLTFPEHALMFFENYEAFTEMKGVFITSMNTSERALAEVDFIGTENGFPYVEYNEHDKRYRVEFNADYTINKTIDITPAGGSSSGSGAYAEVNHGTSDTTFALTPNTFHVWEEVSALTLTLGSETAGVANEYLFQFTSGATATSLTLPDDIKWANDAPPTIAENMIYQVSILKGLASVLEFSNAPALIENKATVSVSGTKYLVSLQYAAASDIVVKVRTVDGPISVQILSGEISKTANPMGPVVDSSAYIESITPVVDTTYNYTW